MNKQKLLILGTGTFALEVADLTADAGQFELCGFVESVQADKAGRRLEGMPIYWVDQLAHMHSDHVAVCGLGTTLRSAFVESAKAAGMQFAQIIHPTAHISSKSCIGDGCVIGVRTVIASYTQIGSHVIVNRGALIGHHTRIGDCVTIGPGANIAGNCVINDRVYVGMGAIVINGVKVDSNSVIGAGSVVTKDVPANVQVLGVPARIMKENMEGRENGHGKTHN